MSINKEEWKTIMAELVENKCAYCQRCCPLKKNYIQIKDNYGKFYFTDAFCLSCYKLYLEGFPWSWNIHEIPFVYSVPQYYSFDVVELEYY